jgi:hypothetical protein
MKKMSSSTLAAQTGWWINYRVRDHTQLGQFSDHWNTEPPYAFP